MRNKKGLGALVVLGGIFAYNSFADQGDPAADMLGYSIFALDSITQAGSWGFTIKTVNGGLIGTNGNVRLQGGDGLTELYIGGKLKVRGNVNLDLNGQNNIRNLPLGGDVGGNLTISNFTLGAALKYAGSLNGGTGMAGAGALTSNPALSIPALAFGTAPSFPSLTVDAVFDGTRWNVGGTMYDTLPAGNYRTIDAGWTINKPLLFGQGTYYCQTLDMKQSNALVANGSGYTRFFVQNSFKMDKGAGQWLRAGDTTAAAQTNFNGKVLIRVESTTDDALHVQSGGAEVSAILYAPNSKLTLSANMKHFGQSLAKLVVFEDGYDGSSARFVPFGGVAAALPTKIASLGSVTKLEDFADTNQVALSSIFSNADSYAVTVKNNVVLADTNAGNLRLRSKADLNGLDTVIVTASNGSGSISDTLYVNVTAVDDAARKVTTGGKNGIPDTTANADVNTDKNISGYWADPEGDAITYAIASVAQNKVDASIVGSNTLRIKAHPGTTGTDTVVVSITSNSKVVYDTVVVTITPSRPYKLGDLTSVTKVEDFADTNQVALNTIFGGASSYAVTVKNAVVTADTAAGQLRLHSIADKNGLDTVIVTATNAQGSTSDTLYVNVTAVDDAARKVTTGGKNGIPDTTANADVNTDKNISGYWADPEGDAITYAIASVAQNKVDASIVGSNTLRIKAHEGATGTDTVIVSITSNSKVVYDTVVVTITPSKPYKLGDLGSVTKLEDFADTNQVALNTIFGGADSYTVQVKNGVVAADTAAGVLRLHSIADKNGMDTVIVTATNAQGSISDTLYVDVTAVDDAARKDLTAGKNGIPDTTANSLSNTDVALGNYWKDPENDVITYAVVEVKQNKLDATIVAPDLLRLKAHEGATGTDTVIVSMTSNGKVVYDTVVVTLAAGKPYKLGDLGSVTKLEDFADTNQVALNTIFGGADSYTVQVKNGVVTADTAAGVLRLHSIADKNGMDTVIVTATNAQGSISDTLYVDVTAVDDAARKDLTAGKNGIPDTTANNQTNTLVELGKYWKDPENDVITYAVVEVKANKLDASIHAPDSLVLRAHDGATGTDTVIVSMTSNGKVVYDTVVVNLGSTSPYKVGDLGKNELTKVENFQDTVKYDLDTVFKGAQTLTAIDKQGIVQAEIVGGVLQITSVQGKFGRDTVIVTATNAAGSVSDTLYVQVLAQVQKTGTLGGSKTVLEDFTGSESIDVSKVFSGADTLWAETKQNKVQAEIVNGKLVMTAIKDANGPDTVIVHAKNALGEVADTLILGVTAVNDEPELKKTELVVDRNVKVGDALGQVLGFDADGDKVSIRQLNYTPDFALRGDSLFVKQVFASTDSVFHVRFELSDSKVTVRRELTIRVHGLIEDLYVRNLKVWTANEAGIPGFASSAAPLYVYDQKGQLVHTWTVGMPKIQESGLAGGAYLVRQAGHVAKIVLE